jgi:hypothetical protein
MVPAKSDTTSVRSREPSAGDRIFRVVTERQSSEVEKVLLFISDAQSRARRASELVERDGADAHIVEALRETQAELGDLHRRLMQGTYYAVPERAQQLAV